MSDVNKVLAEDVRPIKRIFLFSDGCANLGVTSTDGIVRIIQNMQVIISLLSPISYLLSTISSLLSALSL